MIGAVRKVLLPQVIIVVLRGAASPAEGFNAGVVSTNYVGPIVNRGGG